MGGLDGWVGWMDKINKFKKRLMFEKGSDAV